MKEKRKQICLYIVIALLIGIEQLIKFIVINNFSNMPIGIIGNLLKINYCENTGIAFGLGSGNVIVFIIINVVILGIIARFICGEKDRLDFGSKFVFGLVLAGGTSNLIDRIARGFVVDYIDITGLVNFPIFNMADVLIFIGVIGYGILSLKYIIRKNKEEKFEQANNQQ